MVKEKWGEELGYLLGATDVGSSEEQDWVPREEGDLESWGFLGRKLGSHDRTRRHALMYIDSGVSTSRTQVSLRVQGFVERASLATLGNWQGSVFRSGTDSDQADLLRGARNLMRRKPSSLFF